MTPEYAIAVTTLNRREILHDTLAHIEKFTPPTVPILVIDDGSDVPYPNAAWRNDMPTGIARAKNKCIELLMDLGVDHLFLFDDDVYPLERGWETGFLESGQHHLIHQPTEMVLRCPQFGDEHLHVYDTIAGRFGCPTKDPKLAPQPINDTTWGVVWGAGVMYYMTRHAVETVGGMRPEFNRWSCETWEYSYRIHHAGLTEHPFPVLYHSPFRALDAYSSGRRSAVPDKVRNEHRQRNWDLFQSFRGTSDYVPYIEEPFNVDNVAVCMPWRPTPDRIAAHDRCVKYWSDNGFQVFESDSRPDRGWLCNEARNNAVRQAMSQGKAEIVVIADADTLPDNISQVHDAIDAIRNGKADIVWAFDVYRHIPGRYVDTEDLSRATIDKEYRHGSPGGIIVADAEKFWEIGGFDEKFERGAWGFDDEAFMLTARTLLTTARLSGVIWSFNHGVSEYVTGSRDLSDANPNKARAKLFQFADGKPDVMRALIK